VPTVTGVGRWARAALTAGVLLVAVSYSLTFGGAAVASAATDGCSSFSTVAASQGAQIEVAETGALVGSASADTPAAQAAADSQGVSNAYASEPYPGSDPLSVLTLVQTVTQLPLPAYPALAQTSYPTKPEASVAAPGLSLKALSKETSSTASATSGGGDAANGGAGLLAATASAGCGADGTVTALAESDDQAFSVAAGLLRIGRVHSLGRAVVGANGVPKLDSELEVAQMTVAGQSVELTPDGLTNGGSSTALPPTASLSQTLAGAGITITYLAPTRDADGHGIVSAGVAITMARQAQGSRPTTATYVLGQSYARAQSGGSIGESSVDPGSDVASGG
jgi:hypothetical protein